MKSFDFTGMALYFAFGIVLSASGHSIGDLTYWLLFILFIASDVHSSNVAYRRGMDAGSEITKKVWGIK